MFKVMHHIKANPCVEFLCAAIDMAVEGEHFITDIHKQELIELALVRITNKKLHREDGMNVRKVLLTIGESHKKHFTKCVIPVWNDISNFFGEMDGKLKKFINIIEQCVDENIISVNKLLQVMNEYFRADCTHGLSSMDLLYVLKNNDKARSKCIDTILQNSCCYQASTIFGIAREEHKLTTGCSTRQKDLFHKRVFECVMTGMSCLRKHRNNYSVPYDNREDMLPLEYFFSLYASNASATKAHSLQHTRFLEALVEKCELKTIFRYYELIQSTGIMAEVFREVVGEQLCAKYKTIYSHWLKICNHVHYSTILREMLRTKPLFVDIVQDGENKFKLIVRGIAGELKTRHKLQQLLQQFL